MLALIGFSDDPLSSDLEVIGARDEWLFTASQRDELHAVVWAFGRPNSVLHVITTLQTPSRGAILALQELLKHTFAVAAREAGFRSAQCILGEEERSLWQVVQSVGFQRVADLDVLLATSHAWPQTASEGRGMDMTPSPPNDELAAFFAETLIDSLDCPKLSEWRSPEELFESLSLGFPASAGNHQRTWHRVQLNGRQVGCYLLSRTGDDNASVVLEYLGILPSERGRGVGTEVVADIVRHNVRHGLATLVAVDQHNDPAQRIYAKSGFRRISQQSIWLSSIGSDR